MKTLTINIEETKFEALKDFLDSLGVNFYDNSEIDFQISEEQKDHIRGLIKNSKETDFISWKEFKSRIVK